MSYCAAFLFAENEKDPPPPSTPLAPLKEGLEFLEGIPLTEDQKTRISAVYDESQKEIAAFQTEDGQDADRLRRLRERTQKTRQLHEDTFTKIRDILDSEQRKSVREKIRARMLTGNLPVRGVRPNAFELFSDPFLMGRLKNAPETQDDFSATLRSPFELPGERLEPLNFIDKAVLDRLAEKNISPAPLCSDAVFVRRVYLDVIGTLPTLQETTEFLHDETPDKRARLIDRLLERPEFVDYWALKWGDMLRVKAEFPMNLWPNGAMVYQRWIRESIRTNKPVDRFFREILLGSGSNFRSPPANFYRASQNRDAHSLAETVALTLLGERLEHWPREKRDQLAVFFSRVAIKGTAEWKEEIVYWNDQALDNPEVVFPDGTKGRVEPGNDPREEFARWLFQPENPRLSRNFVNRTWFWLFGRGIVHEPDDFREDNPASHPALLDSLSAEFIRSKYDFKQLIRLILNSRTYQQSSIARSDEAEAEILFAFYPTRQLDAEILQDMFRQIFGVHIAYASDVPEPFTNIPVWRRTFLLPDGSITSSFLETFGRPPRDSGVLTERNLTPSASQRLFLINSSEMVQWIEQTWRLRNTANAAAASGKPEERRKLFLNCIWLTILSRYPTEEETELATSLLNNKNRNETLTFQDIIWALVNSKEFLCRH